MWPRFRASWSRDVDHPRRLKMRRLPRRSGVGSPVGVFCFFAGSRDALSCFMRCPCAGWQLLFFSLPPQHASLFGVFAFAFDGIRVLLARFTRRPCAGRCLLFFSLPPQHASLFGVFAFAFAGIRELLAHSTRRPCAGRHLLFFAAATCVVVWCFRICFRWHPRFVSALHAAPLCGTELTFLCRRNMHRCLVFWYLLSLASANC